ncbi:MAG: helix-turn-helix domain-containing protein [Verrucomicrobiota bacterium]|nr:helix-turn-helix domain-containing protein [Verrucomicrobiota bacterium]
MSPKRIGIVGFDHCTALHVAGPADAFAAAFLDNGYGGRIGCYEVCTIGITMEPFRADSGMHFLPQYSFATAPDLDTIIVAGGTGIRDEAISQAIGQWLLNRASQTRRMAAICSGIYAYGPTGLLNGRAVSTHWRYASDVSRRFPALRVDHKRPLVHDGKFYTSTGVTAGIDLALALVEEDYGPYVARAVNSELVMYMPRPQHVEPATAPSADGQSKPTDRFGELIAWVMHNLHGDLSVEAMARRACMSPQHFSRAFKSVFGTLPSEFVENVRLNEARRRLGAPGKTLRSVGESVGFSSPESFRKAFRRRFGVNASSYFTQAAGQTSRARTAQGGHAVAA